MCGISGIIKKNKDKVNDNEILSLNNCLAHRGPEGEGIYKYKNSAIGHRRLAFIDVSGGKQPITNENETLWITFNGEIYNYGELHQILEARGHKFRTKTDTEVIVHAYEEWGVDCLSRFRGMFAFGILDKNKNEIFLARDPLGIKPLIYYVGPEYFIFASELSAVKSLDNLSLEINLNSLDKYLWLQYIPAPDTIYKNTYKLEPGYFMRVGLNGEIKQRTQYWDLDFRPNHKKSQVEWIEELDSILKDSVNAHLVSEVPFGAFLSGGIDSSIVVSYMSEIMDKPVQTFTIGFEESIYDESKYAEEVAKKFGTQHYVSIVKPNALDILPDLVKHFGEPFGDSSAIPTYFVSKFAREKVTMVLSGDGGDELFAGYKSYQAWLDYQNRPRSEIVGKFAKLGLPRSLFYKNKASLDGWLGFVNYLPISTRHRLWNPDLRKNLEFTLPEFESFFEKASKFDLVNTVQYMDIKTYMTYDILTKVDISSMMSSLEVRTPIIDVKVAEFAATIPSSLNIKKSQNSYIGKLLLKKLLERKLGSVFVNREKMGFSVPIQKWFEENGQWSPTVHDKLMQKSSAINNYFDSNVVQEIVESDSKNHVWLLLFLEEWLSQNKL